ncbi:MAG: hypothetical protein M5R37_04255 [Melioribacteraceae bacterium]|nr:hypothetical protein [Melioribacteraceae bacterium]
MKLKIILLFFVLMFLNSFSQPSNFGLGLMFGEPSGINVKYWVSESNAIVGGLGWHFLGRDDGLSIHADYLYHIDNTFNTNISFPLYYGFGVRLRNEKDKFGLGFRGVGGILFYPDNLPMDIFLEFVPVFRLLPETKLEIDLAVGARYYFN